MTSALKIEQIYQSGNQELALELLNSLSDYSCIRYLITFHGKKNVKLLTNKYPCKLIIHASELFAYRMRFI